MTSKPEYTTRIQEIEARLAAASKGPWKHYINHTQIGDCAHVDMGYKEWLRNADAELVANSHSDIRFLLDELKRREEQVRVMKNVLGNVRSMVDEYECRGDEDCDHCLIVHHTIDPALAAVEGLGG